MKIIKIVTIILVIVIVLSFSLVACTNEPGEDANLEWTNEKAVYAYIKAGFEGEILKDVEGSFKMFSFQKVYVVEKCLNIWTPLGLLFILEESGAAHQQEFIDSLMQDARINHARKSRDLPFETVDTRHIERVKDTITVGETLTLEVKGINDYYYQPFDFNGVVVKPTNYVAIKTYKKSDFPQVKLKSVKAIGNSMLYLELKEEGYFNVVKAIDVLSRLSTIEKAEPDESEIVYLIPPIWQISDNTIAYFIEDIEWNDFPKAIVKGNKAGKVTIDFDGVSCEIVVK